MNQSRQNHCSLWQNQTLASTSTKLNFFVLLLSIQVSFNFCYKQMANKSIPFFKGCSSLVTLLHSFQAFKSANKLRLYFNIYCCLVPFNMSIFIAFRLLMVNYIDKESFLRKLFLRFCFFASALWLFVQLTNFLSLHLRKDSLQELTFS